VHFERPRARRYPFVASIELTDLESEKLGINQGTQSIWMSCEHTEAPPRRNKSQGENCPHRCELRSLG